MTQTGQDTWEGCGDCDDEGEDLHHPVVPLPLHHEQDSCTKLIQHTLTNLCLSFRNCMSMVGGLLLRGISNNVLTPPAAAADVAAVIPVCSSMSHSVLRVDQVKSNVS